MSLRYLVGTGARNWSNAAIWSDTSGGTGGFSMPTSADAVIFDANSGTGNLTLDVAASVGSLNSSALTAIVTLVSSVYTFSNYGSLTLNGTYSKFSFTGTSYYYQRGTGTITTNGNLFMAMNRLYIDGVGITVTNGDNMNVGASSIYFANGTWDTNNNTISIGQYNTIAGTKTLNLGSSSLYLINYEPINGLSTLPYTLNAETSTIYVSADFYGSGKTFYNVVLTGPDLRRLAGTNTYNNLSIIPSSWAVTSTRNISENHTVNGTLTITGFNNTNYRLLLASNTIGTPRTITCNGTITASNVDFRDITLAGSANRDLSAITGGSGDCGGNSGIPFTPAVKQYFKHTSGAVNFSDATKWFSDFSPRTTAGRVPLPQDDWDFDAASFAGTSTVTVNVPRIGRSCDMSAVNQAVTWSLANAIECYGSYVLGENITPTWNFNIVMFGRGTFNLNLFNKTVYSVIFQNNNGIITSLSNITCILSVEVYYNTTVYFNNYNVTFAYCTFGSSSGYVANVYLGSGVFTSNTNSPTAGFNVRLPNNIYSGTSTIKFIAPSGSNNVLFLGNNKIFNKVWFSGSHTGNFDITGSNTIAELIVDAGRKVRFTAGTTQQIGKATIGAGASIDSITAATHTLNYTGTDVVETDGISVKNSIATPANKWYAGDGSTDLGGNIGWIFGSAFTPIVSWL